MYRAYPPGVDPAAAWTRECSDPGCEASSRAVNELNRRIHRLTQAAARRGQDAGAGWTERARFGAAGQPLSALKTYLLSPFLTEQHLDELVRNLERAYLENC